MKIAFLGTPEFAVPSLTMLHAAGHTLLVFTQPDKQIGRHAVLTAPAVKQCAQKLLIPVCQPQKIRGEEGQAALKAFAPDLMVTAAFGQILSAENLAVPTHGCINVHGSLLPKYRGAAPIQWAVINGEAETGITTMLTDVGLDTGDILLKRAVAVDADETAGELYDRMAVIGAEVLKETIEALEKGALPQKPQNPAEATTCRMLKKEDGKLDFSQPALAVHNRVRGVNPWPGAYAFWRELPLKIWRTKLSDVHTETSLSCGSCFGDAKRGLFVCCGDGRALEITELQAPGGKRMQARSYLLGKPMSGERLI